MRTVTAYGLIAGISLRDMRRLTPGFVCDMYVMRRRYDDEQHGVQRENDNHDISAEDLREFDEMIKAEE